MWRADPSSSVPPGACLRFVDTMTLSARYAPACAALSEKEMERIHTARILVVGAGGIGCEVLKDLVLVGVGHVEVVRTTGCLIPDRSRYH